ncbi:hypothetical protein HN499_05185 [archaeon]|jgi:hypothetical protein|nr:hypothetical protein [archaeon]
MIIPKARSYVGVRFSNLCEIQYDENGEAYDVTFKYPELELKVKKAFEDREIHPSEVTPELLSLVLKLEYESIQDSHDAVIGLEIRDIDIGTRNVAMCYPKVISDSFNVVKKQLKHSIGEKDCNSSIMLYLIGSVHTPNELAKIE